MQSTNAEYQDPHFRVTYSKYGKSNGGDTVNLILESQDEPTGLESHKVVPGNPPTGSDASGFIPRERNQSEKDQVRDQNAREYSGISCRIAKFANRYDVKESRKYASSRGQNLQNGGRDW